jgi:hypothetical protein
MALVDLCARRADPAGSPPSVLYTREIAERIAAIYWPQVMDYRWGPEVIQLRQITLPRSAITEAVLEFRRVAEAAGATSLTLARQRLVHEYSQMLDRVEVAVAEQPLPSALASRRCRSCTTSVGGHGRHSPRAGCTAMIPPGSRYGCALAPATNSCGWPR